MSALLEIQHAMRRALLAPPDPASDELGECIVGGAAAAATALDIYRRTCIGALLNALRLSYPAVRWLVGDEFFEGAAQAFIEVTPPADADLNAYGAQFPLFLAQFGPAASVPYLGDVAQLEWAVNRALHAPDAAPLDLARLARASAAELAALRLQPHPSMTLLQLSHPADDIWRAVLARDEAAMSVALADRAVWLLVERTPAGVQVQRLAASAWRFLAALCELQPLAVAAETVDDATCVEHWLAEHLAAGRFISMGESA